MTSTYIYEQGQQPQTFLLLHGTGGDENSLLPIAQALMPTYGYLSLRGAVSLDKGYRFFEEASKSLIDPFSMAAYGQKLVADLEEICQEEDIDPKQFIPLGFSNGGSMISHLLLEGRLEVQKALLFATPFGCRPVKQPDLSHLHVWMSAGRADELVSVEESQALAECFKKRGAKLDQIWVQDHKIYWNTLDQARQFLIDERKDDRKND